MVCRNVMVLRRFSYEPVTRISKPWKPRIFKGSDEFRNRCINIVIPILGWFAFFYEPHMIVNGFWLSGTSGNKAIYISDNIFTEAHIAIDSVKNIRYTIRWDEHFDIPAVITRRQMASIPHELHILHFGKNS